MLLWSDLTACDLISQVQIALWQLGKSKVGRQELRGWMIITCNLCSWSNYSGSQTFRVQTKSIILPRIWWARLGSMATEQREPSCGKHCKFAGQGKPLSANPCLWLQLMYSSKNGLLDHNLECVRSPQGRHGNTHYSLTWSRQKNHIQMLWWSISL